MLCSGVSILHLNFYLTDQKAVLVHRCGETVAIEKAPMVILPCACEKYAQSSCIIS